MAIANVQNFVADHTVQQPSMHVSRPGSPTVALIPAYNEQRFIGSIVLDARSYVDHVIVIDDGSSDLTAEIARRAGATVLQHRQNRGKAAAVNTGFQYVRTLHPAAVVMLDGDGQHCADDIPSVLQPIIDGQADITIGSRFLDIRSEIPSYRLVGQHGLTLMTNLASGVSVTDSQSGFRAFSAAALEHLFFSKGGFSIESEMQFLVSEHRLRVAEVPIKVIYAEKAKRNPVSHGMQVINGILQLVGQARPLLYFGMSGLSFIVLGMALGLYVIDIYRTAGELAIGYSLITVLLSVIGMLLFFAGVILHSTRGMLLDLQRAMVERVGGFSPDRNGVNVYPTECPSVEQPMVTMGLVQRYEQ